MLRNMPDTPATPTVDTPEAFDSPTLSVMRRFWWVGLIVIAAIVMVGVLTTVAQAASSAAVAGTGGPYTVVVAGAGTGVGSVTINEDGSSQQYTNVAFPATYAIPAGTQVVAVVAQAGEGTTNIGCEVIDGQSNALKDSRSTGPYAVASCAVRLR